MQLVRLAPPGFGGIERVAHELALAWRMDYRSSVVFSFSPNYPRAKASHVPYISIHLPCTSLHRLFLPCPTSNLLRLLTSRSPLHVHLPCPTILLLAVLARVIRPSRQITVHWHSFLQPARSPLGLAFALYQFLAIRSLCLFQRTVTTSPVLRDALVDASVPSSKIYILPCSVSAQHESLIPIIEPPVRSTFNLVYVGRLASYKRVDWLIQAVADAQDLIRRLIGANYPSLFLNIVGSGPYYQELRSLAEQLLPDRVRLHGRIDDEAKIAILQDSDLLLLPSDSCHEAFGIVQLEAMSLGVPSLAISRPLSGTSWVSTLPSFQSVSSRSELAQQIFRLATDFSLQRIVRVEARSRYLSVFARNIWHQAMQRAFHVLT